MRKQCGTLLSLFFSLTLAANSHAADPQPTTLESFMQKHQAGIRLGGWANLGDMPPVRDTVADFETSFHDGSFFFEGFYAHRLSRVLMGEISAGIVNRGSVTFRVDDRSNIGNLLVYSILVQAKVYPLARTTLGIQPYLTAGGGLYYGRRSVQFSSSIDYYYYPGLDEQSATQFNYAVGGGLDYPIASQIGLDLNVKYLPITFGDPLMTIDDYSALVVSVGIKYLFANSANESDRKNIRRMQ